MFYIIYRLYAHHNRSPRLILFSTRPVLLRLANTRTEQNDVAVYLQTVSWGACFQSRQGYLLSWVFRGFTHSLIQIPNDTWSRSRPLSYIS